MHVILYHFLRIVNAIPPPEFLFRFALAQNRRFLKIFSINILRTWKSENKETFTETFFIRPRKLLLGESASACWKNSTFNLEKFVPFLNTRSGSLWAFPKSTPDRIFKIYCLYRSPNLLLSSLGS